MDVVFFHNRDILNKNKTPYSSTQSLKLNFKKHNFIKQVQKKKKSLVRYDVIIEKKI